MTDKQLNKHLVHTIRSSKPNHHYIVLQVLVQRLLLLGATTQTTNVIMSASLSAKPIKAVLVKARGLPEAGACIMARVGSKDTSWEDRGSNDGAVSDNAAESGGEVSIGWLVYNTFHRDDLELMIRVMTRQHRMVGREIMGELKVALKNVNQKEVQVMGVTVNITIGSEQIFADYPTPVPWTHPCGTNHFGMLPDGIQELSPSDLDGCILWGEAHEPITSWVACHFLYHKKAFQNGDMLVKSPVPPIPKVQDHTGKLVNASASGAKSGYGVSQAPDRLISNAVPMLEIQPREGDTKPVVIADGVIINYLIIPLLYPQRMTEDILRWEQKIGYELIPAMWREQDGADFCTAFRRTCPNYPAPFKSRFSPMMRQPVCAAKRLINREMRVIKNYVGQEYNPNPKVTLHDIYTQFKNEMSQHKCKQDFMGGEKPNATDISFYGINVLRFVTDVGPTRRLIDEVGLLPWMYRMLDILPPSECLKMEFFGPSMAGWKGGWLMDPPKFDPVKLGAPPGVAVDATSKNGYKDDI